MPSLSTFIKEGKGAEGSELGEGLLGPEGTEGVVVHDLPVVGEKR